MGSTRGRGGGPRPLILATVLALVAATLGIPPVVAAEPGLDTSVAGTMAEAELSPQGDGLAKLTVRNPHHFWVAVDLEPRKGSGIELRMANPVTEDLGGVWAGGGLIPPEGTAAWMVKYDPAGSGSQTVRVHYDLSTGGLMAMVGDILQIVSDGLGGGLARLAPEKVAAAIHALAASPVVTDLLRNAQQGANPLTDIVPLARELLGTETGREVLRAVLTDAGLTGVTTARLARLSTAIGVLDGAALVVDLLTSVLTAHSIGEVTVSLAQPRAHWVAPAAEATVGSRLDLAVWPEPAVQVAAVTFRTAWDDGSTDLCTATAVGGDGLWRCTADLATLGVPAGRLDLSFSMKSPSGEVTSDTGGPWPVTYKAKASGTTKVPTDPRGFLLAGIPASVREKGTCETRTDRLQVGTVVAVNCYPDSKLIEEMAYYLMRPRDARNIFAERMAQFHLRAGGDCARGIAGIESTSQTLSSGCYHDEDGKANLRFATSAACPAVYWAVLSKGKDIARLSAEYARVVGKAWGVDLPRGGGPSCESLVSRVPSATPTPRPRPVPTPRPASRGLSGRYVCRSTGMFSCSTVAMVFRGPNDVDMVSSSGSTYASSYKREGSRVSVLYIAVYVVYRLRGRCLINPGGDTFCKR